MYFLPTKDYYFPITSLTVHTADCSRKQIKSSFIINHIVQNPWPAFWKMLGDITNQYMKALNAEHTPQGRRKGWGRSTSPLPRRHSVLGGI